VLSKKNVSNPEFETISGILQNGKTRMFVS